MLSIDPPDEEEEGEENRSTGRQTPNPAHGQTTQGSKSPRLPNPDGTGEEPTEMSVEVHEEMTERRVPPITIVRSFFDSKYCSCVFFKSQILLVILKLFFLIHVHVLRNNFGLIPKTTMMYL